MPQNLNLLIFPRLAPGKYLLIREPTVEGPTGTRPGEVSWQYPYADPLSPARIPELLRILYHSKEIGRNTGVSWDMLMIRFWILLLLCSRPQLNIQNLDYV